ncbi:CCA tRNA nucleotidyltransferase [Limnobacter humi]|uniref:CCA tRNA nucleotidyltransferase n=1 Tax=Limnobacter humi TaxID=1778671 RepID=A0ABT1WCZ0_9BURK|nr:CCA tRNA nucleotidyltransferase [Limnobacter humi]
MAVYVVGGAVRDALLGSPSQDRDWVVVGATPQDMAAAGFAPVGADFPVFLHPQTHEEYALARTERKSGQGYKGFTFFADPSVSLEEDLRRRDFTVNAMAMDSKGRVIDPYDGWSDIQDRTFRHVSRAFLEDPLRVLRLGRFMARFTDFRIDPVTFEMCRGLVMSGELQHLTPERVFAEFNRGMGEKKPARLFKLLSKLNAWDALLPGMDCALAHFEEAQFRGLLDLGDVELRWAYALGLFMDREHLDRVAAHLKFPNELRDLCRVVASIQALEGRSSPGIADVLALLTEIDVYRKPERAFKALQLFQRGGQTDTIALLGCAVQQQLDGTYKAALRQHLEGLPQAVPADMPGLIAAFRQAWLSTLKQTQSASGAKPRSKSRTR